MKLVPAIVESEIEQLADAVDAASLALYDAEHMVEKLERQAYDARGAVGMRRLELGRLLARARPHWPERGPKAKGWGEFLSKRKIEQPRAWELMKLAGYVEISSSNDETPDHIPTLVEAGARGSQQSMAGGPAPFEIDRNTWCTPVWITEALGDVDLDPCANERSHVRAGSTFRLDRGQDGLELAANVGHDWRVFINPPYSDVTPWVQAYAHTRFVYLLKFDPSTKWFAELIAKTGLVLIPRGTRVQFEAPLGVPPEKSEANQFPHALFFARADDAPKGLLDRCYAWRIEPST